MSLESVSIVGGGPVGATLSLLLAKQKIASQVFEIRALGAAHNDTRALALSYGSRLIFERIGVWQKILPHTTAINTIHVSQKGGIGRSKLQAKEHGLDALGYVVSYGAVAKALDSAIKNNRYVTMQNEASVSAINQMDTNKNQSGQTVVTVMQSNKIKKVASRLTVIADGGRTLEALVDIKRDVKAYGHDALVTKVTAELPHENIAYERFTTTGPMALLPNGEHDFSLVWTGKKEKIDALISLSENDFLQALHQHFGDRVGAFLQVENRLSFPLMKANIESKITMHLAVIGNAAQTMHPVAGQGFNVGLRDAATLAKKLATCPLIEWGAELMLNEYLNARKRDTKGGLLFTDFLVNIFSNDVIGLSKMSGLGLGLLDVLQPAKSLMVSKMSHGK